MPARQDHSGVFLDVDAIFPEILGRNPFDMDERSEVNFQSVLLGQVVVGRFVGFRLRLGDEDRLYFQGLGRLMRSRQDNSQLLLSGQFPNDQQRRDFEGTKV